MKRIQKNAFAFLLLAATAFGQDTNFAVRLACEMQTAGPASLADLTWQQGTTPHVAVSPLRLGRPIAVDPLTTVKMIIGQSGMVTNYALATNWLATNGVYYVQWPTVGTNSAGTNATAQAWWYTIHFERDGRRYWTGDGRLYIEPTTSTAADGLNWQTITAGAAIDTEARAQIAIVSNMVDDIEVGAVAYGITSNTAYEGNLGHAVSNLARSAYTSATGAAAVAAAAQSAVNGLPQMNWKVWVDAETNYYAQPADRSTTITNRSFSSIMRVIIATNTMSDGVVINFGNTTLPDGKIRFFEIDGEIATSGTMCMHLMGDGGTHFAPAQGYDGRMFVFGATNRHGGKLRVSQINFSPGYGYTSENTNAFLDFYNTGNLVVENCYFDGIKGTAISVGRGLSPFVENVEIKNNWIYSTRNIHPLVTIEAAGSSAIWGASLAGNYFKSRTNAAPMVDIGPGDVRYASLIGNSFNNIGNYAATGVVYRSGYGHSAIANSFFLFNSAQGGQPIVFDSSASNDFKAVVAANNFGYGTSTNAPRVGAYSHGVRIYGNGGDSVPTIQSANYGGYYANLATLTSGTVTRVVANGTTNAPDAAGVVDLGTIAGSGWTNLSFDGTGNAITGATASTTTLTLQRGTITGGSTTNTSGVRTPFVIPYTNTLITIDPTNGYDQALYMTGTGIISYVVGTTSTVSNVRLDLFSGTNVVTITSPALASGTLSTTNANTLLYDKKAWATNGTVRLAQ